MGTLLELLILKRSAVGIEVSDRSRRGLLLRGLLQSGKKFASEDAAGFFHAPAASSKEAEANDFADVARASLVAAGVANVAALRLSGALHELLGNIDDHAGERADCIAGFEVRDRHAWVAVADTGRGALAGYVDSPLPKRPVDASEALRWAVIDHLSRTGIPGQGTGFQTVIQAVRSLDGCIRVRSDAASIEVEQHSDQSNFLLREQGPLRGFVVSFLLRW